MNNFESESHSRGKKNNIVPLRNLSRLPAISEWDRFLFNQLSFGKLTFDIGEVFVYNPPDGGIDIYFN